MTLLHRFFPGQQIFHRLMAFQGTGCCANSHHLRAFQLAAKRTANRSSHDPDISQRDLKAFMYRHPWIVNRLHGTDHRNLPVPSSRICHYAFWFYICMFLPGCLIMSMHSYIFRPKGIINVSFFDKTLGTQVIISVWIYHHIRLIGLFHVR